MILHTFNPEHDIALAFGGENFTSPHAGRQLRHDLGWLPMLWAKQDDRVLVDDVEYCIKSIANQKGLLAKNRDNEILQNPQRTLCDSSQLPHIKPNKVEVWGWDLAIKSRLKRAGVNELLLPTAQQIDDIRELSHRHTSANILETLKRKIPVETLIGKAHECSNMSMIDDLLNSWKHVVLKAPWSSSGRGVRFVKEQKSPSIEGWIKNILINQGSIMVEPYYNKVKDFGMEFSSDGQGNISYLGLSLFHTTNGAYTGNLLATEQRKREEMERYVPNQLLDLVQQHVCQTLSQSIGIKYQGPFGIDMMICSSSDGKKFLLHPCLEINMRHTMGHVALSLTKLVNRTNDNDMVRVMRISYEDNQYKLKIAQL